MNYENIINTHNANFKSNLVLSSDSDISENRIANTNILTKIISMIRNKTSSGMSYMNFITYAYYNWLPEYFFTTPASSTGKYHPDFANRSNGLILHSYAVTKLTSDLYHLIDDNDHIYNNMICAAFFHDMFKYGDPTKYTPKTYTCHEHPQLAADFFRHPDVIAKALEFDLDENNMRFIADVINSHMGPYTTNKYSNITLPLPNTKYEHLLHHADMITSRKENDIVKDVLL